jgi:hypothetical protein
MGTEFRLRFRYEHTSVLLDAVRHVPGCRELADGRVGFDFREPESSSAMPDATLILEAEGAYFCDHGGVGREIL